MSDQLAVTQDPNDLLALAETLGVPVGNDLSSVLYQGGTTKYTNYQRPKQVRQIFDAHKLDGVIKWTELDYDGNPSNRTAEELYQLDSNGGEPRPLTAITELRGVIVNYQQRDELRYFDGEKTQTLCSVIGYTQPNGEVVRDLPNLPYSMKHTFVQDRATKKWSVDTTKPNKSVLNLGLVGFRGERVTSCAECIRCGMSSEVIEGIGEGGSDKTIACEPRGKLYFAVFEVSTVKKVKSDSKVKGKAKYVDTVVTEKIADLVDIEGESMGPFLLLEVPMSKSSIQGKYMKDDSGKKDEERTVVGYESFVKDLAYKYSDPRNALRQPNFHYVSLTFKKHPFAPTFQANFASLGTASIEQFKAGVSFWKENIPEKTIETLEIEQVQAIEKDGTVNVPSVNLNAEPRRVEQPVDIQAVPDVDTEDLPW